MQIQDKEFILVKNEKGKVQLCKVTDTDQNKAILCDKFQKNKNRATYIEYAEDDVVANLGFKPRFGNCYDTAIEFVRKDIPLEPWASFLVFRKMEDTEMNLLTKAVNRCTDKLENIGLFPKNKPIELHIKDRKGVFGGSYTRFHDEKQNDIILLKPSDFIDLDYLIYHEVGHGVWYQMMDDKARAEWIELFYKNINLIKDNANKIKKMRKELIETGSVSSYRKELDEEEQEIFRAVMKYIKDNYSLKPLHVSILMSEDNDLTEIWPDESIPMPHTSVLVTDYALKEPDELFCESFAIFMEDKKLPKSVEKIMNRTVAAINTNGEDRKPAKKKGFSLNKKKKDDDK